MKFFPLIWSNLKRKKLRTSLTILSILVAFVLFGLLASIKQALGGGLNMTSADRLMVRDKVSIIQTLKASYKARMERIPGVVLATHQTWFGGYYQDPKNFFMQNPVEPEDFLSMHPEMTLPPEQKKTWLATRTGAIIGRQSAEKYHWKIGDKIPIRSPIWHNSNGSDIWEFDLVGIYDGDPKKADLQSMYFRYDFFDESLAPANRGQAGWYTIRIKDPSKAAEIAKLVDAEFENSDAETKTEPEGAMAQEWAAQVGNISLIVAGILSAVFFTILLVAGNTMAQAIRERTGELGVLKAIGFTNAQIVTLVLVESCLLAVLGGVIGLGLAWLFAAGGDPTHGMMPMFFFPTHDLLIGLGLSVVLGLVTGIIPAIQAMRLQVAVALRRM